MLSLEMDQGSASLSNPSAASQRVPDLTVGFLQTVNGDYDIGEGFFPPFSLFSS